MAGLRKLRKMQLGPEATAGTAVAATTIWRGLTNGIEALDDVQFIEEDIGSLGGANRTMKVAVGAQCEVVETPFTFEQFPWLCQAGVEAQKTGVADGAGSGKIYTFDFPLTAANTLKTLTVEAGNNQKVYELEYGFVPSFTVRGEPDAAVMMAGMFRGRQRTATTFTEALTAPSVDEAVFNMSQLYLDAAGGTMGNTAITCALMGFNIQVNTGLMPEQAGNGSMLFCDLSAPAWEIQTDVVFRHLTAEDTEEANWLAETARLLEIKLTGPALASAGTTYTYKTARFQFPGKWTKFAVLSDRNGTDIITGTFMAKYDPTAALGPKIVTVNETASYWT